MRKRNLPWSLGMALGVLLTINCGCTALQNDSGLEEVVHQIHANADVVQTIDGVKELKLNLGRVTRELLSESSPPIFFYDVGYENAGDKRSVRQELLRSLTTADGLEELNLAGLSELSTLAFCRDLKNLKTLDVSFTNISLEDLRVLKGHRNLKELRLSGCRVDPQLVAILVEIPNLQTLALDGIELKQEHLESLRNCQNLREVFLRGSKIVASDSDYPFRIISQWEGGGIL